MYKNFQNKIISLPKGNPNPWINFFWMLVFSPFLLLLGGYVFLVLGTLGYELFKLMFG